MRILLSALLLCLCGGCSIVHEVTDERYNRNNAAGDRWLSDQLEDARINVSGPWISNDWGRAELTQSGRRISGRIGDYQVKGVASGERAYLLIADQDWYYYSAVLEMPRPGLLTGHFSRLIPFTRGLARPMRLEKLAF